MNKPVTLKDIARETGVDVSTASRALDPRTRTMLTREVVERVSAAARRMGYRKNHFARGLRTRRSMTVGMVLPDITNTVFAAIVRGAESVLEPHGYAPIIVNTDDDPLREAALFNVLLERGVDGILNTAVRTAIPRAEAAGPVNVPVVTANREFEGSPVPSVVNDDAEGMRLMMRLLHENGHRQIAHVSGPLTTSTGRKRASAFRGAAADLGLDARGAAIVESSRYDEAEGQRCAQLLLDGPVRFTAIACANDRLALGAIDALNRRGLTCPGDVSVTGFNDIPFLDHVPPGLTTVRVQQFAAGKLSAELLVKMMTDPDAPIPRTTILPVSAVERGSVAPPKPLTGRGQKLSGQSKRQSTQAGVCQYKG